MKLRSVLVACSLPLAAAQSQRPTFSPTLFWESGLINIPAAYASPLGGDVALNFSRLSLDSAQLGKAGKAASFNLSFTASLWGKGEVGVSVFSSDLKSGLFGKLMLIDETDGIWRTGLRHWLPSVAVGVRNIGNEKTLNRLAITGDNNFNTSGSLYGVATKTFVLAHGGYSARPDAQFSLTGGYGTGMFRDDGGEGKNYAAAKTGGMFGGISIDFATGKYSSFSVLAEQDGWGLNAGVRADFRGLRFTAYAMELTGANSAGNVNCPDARFPTCPPPYYAGGKVAVSVGWQTNFLALVRGDRLAQKTDLLETAQGDLATKVRLSQQLIDVIQGQIEALQAITTQEKSAERAELERRLRDEQEALRRLQDLIKAREAATKKPPQ